MTREPLTSHQFTDGCPSTWPWLQECIHYNGPGKHEALVQRAVEDVRAGGRKHVVGIQAMWDAVHDRYPDNEKYNSPISDRNAYVVAISGWRDDEPEQRGMRDLYIRDFGEEKAAQIIAEQKIINHASLATAFLLSHNYDPLDVFEGSKEIKPKVPVIKDATVKNLVPLFRQCCDVWVRQFEGWSDGPTSKTVLSGCEDSIVVVGQHFLGGDIIKVTRYASKWDAEHDQMLLAKEAAGETLTEDEEESRYDVGTNDYYFLQIGDERVDLANAYSEFCEYAEGPVKEETVVSMEEMLGDAYRVSTVAVLMRRIGEKLGQW